MNLISIQSHVAYGHVGNSAAVFALQRLGCEVWPVHTVQFSNHTGYGAWKGEVFAAARISEVIDGIAGLGVLGACDGVLSGYIGAVETGEAILAAVGKVKAANPNASYCCDPVIGNRTRGEFVRPGIAEFMRERAMPAAGLVTPNHFELDRLAGRETRNLAAIIEAVDDIHARGPRAVLVTSVRSDATPADSLDVIASDAGGRYLARTPLLATPANGAGRSHRGPVLLSLFAQRRGRGCIGRRDIVGVRAIAANAGRRRIRNRFDRRAGRVGGAVRDICAGQDRPLTNPTRSCIPRRDA